MKTLFQAGAVVAVIVALHAIPELAVRFLPTWLMAGLAFATIAGLVWAALWAFQQAFERREN